MAVPERKGIRASGRLRSGKARSPDATARGSLAEETTPSSAMSCDILAIGVCTQQRSTYVARCPSCQCRSRAPPLRPSSPPPQAQLAVCDSRLSVASFGLDDLAGRTGGSRSLQGQRTPLASLGRLRTRAERAALSSRVLSDVLSISKQFRQNPGIVGEHFIATQTSEYIRKKQPTSAQESKGQHVRTQQNTMCWPARRAACQGLPNNSQTYSYAPPGRLCEPSVKRRRVPLLRLLAHDPHQNSPLGGACRDARPTTLAG